MYFNFREREIVLAEKGTIEREREQATIVKGAKMMLVKGRIRKARRRVIDLRNVSMWVP